MKKLMVLATLLVCHVMSVSAYDFYSKTEFSVEEALDSVNLYYSINPDKETVSLTIGPEAYKFKHIRIPETVVHNDTTYTVTEIAHNAFSGGSINIVEMANTITKIGDRAFYDCGIDSIKFSSSLKSIGEYAFWDSNLTAVYLPEGLEEIKTFTFAIDAQKNPKLGVIILPSTLKSMGSYAFAYNVLAKSLIIPNKITKIESGVFHGCANLETLKLPDNLTSIGSYSFLGCGLLEINSTLFPSSLIEIGKNAFQGSKAKSISLPNSITSLGESVFSGCSNLQSIKFGTGLKELPNFVCNSCAQLINVEIPEGIKSIGAYAFAGSTRLSKIKFPQSLTSLGGSAFNGSGLTEITIPSGMDTITTQAFAYCSYLKQLVIPGTVKVVQNSAFNRCSGLESITIEEGVEELNTSSFGSCNSLTKVKLPKSLKILGRAFQNCEKLEEVDLGGSALKTIDVNAFKDCASLKNLILPDSLQKIDQCAFATCTSLENIELPKSLVSIGVQAFYGCTSLANITIPHNVSGWGKECFYGCTNLKEVHYKRAVVPSLSSTIRLIEDGNQCTLYIPTGSKDEYEACNNWNNFYAIVEEEIGYDILYRVSVSKTGKGVVTVNESTSANTDILSGTNVKLSIVPDNGWEIGTVLIDGVDVSAECADGEYEIETLDRNISVAVTFEELPAILQLKQADGGSIDIPVVKGTQFTCTFTVEEGWKINNVRYNNLDITSALEEGNKYTTPAIKNDAILSVAYEKPGDSSVSALESESNVKAYVMNDGTLVVLGVENASPINIVTAEGKIEATLIAQNGRASHQLKEHGVYLVNTPGKTIKVAY